MRSNIIKNLTVILVIAAFVTALASCNRGLGCPNNFSIDSSVEVIE